MVGCRSDPKMKDDIECHQPNLIQLLHHRRYCSVIPPLCDANGYNRADLLFQTGEQVNRGENSEGYGEA